MLRSEEAEEIIAIAECMKREPENYELFVRLAEYYADRNLYQTYLCYEQAEFYCADIQKKEVFEEEKKNLSSHGYFVPGLAIVILSYNACREMRDCLESLKKYALPSYQIIVIDNASQNMGDGKEVVDYLKEQTGILFVENYENVGFPAGCNQGIRLAESDRDILLLNNDTVVFPNSLFWLRMGLYENETVGATGSESRIVRGTENGQYEFAVGEEDSAPKFEEVTKYAYSVNVPLEFPYERKIFLSGFAMMLKRQALDEIGFLDETFSPGNFEDADLSIRLLMREYQLVLCKNSFIFHAGGTSFEKEPGIYQQLLSRNRILFQLKWGIDIMYFIRICRRVMPYLSSEEIDVYEIGCGMGATLGYIRDNLPHSRVYGIEANQTVVSCAVHYIPTITCGTIENDDMEGYHEEMFHCVLLLDGLSEVQDLGITLKKIKRYMKKEGCIVAAIPEFVLQQIFVIFAYCGFEITEMGAKYPDLDSEYVIIKAVAVE